jgi:hypothetical protein
MPSKDNLPEGHGRFEFRSGMGGAWGGMVTEGDPSTNNPFRPRVLINCDLVGGEIRERPGLTKLYASALHSASACIRNIVPLTIPKPYKLWLVTAGCPGLSASVGFSINAIDTEQDPEFQRVTYYDGTAAQIVLGRYNENMYIGTDAALRRLQMIRQPWGTESLAVSGSTQDTPLRTFTGFTVRCLAEFDGKLFIGLDNGAGASKVVTYDGISFRDDVTGIDPPVCFAKYRVQNGGDALVMGTSNTNTLYIRATGDSPATWTSLGTVAAKEMVSYRDVLYIATETADIYSWNGTALAVARTPASAVTTRCLTLFNGFLYFGYETATSAIIGKLNSSGSWTDVEKNLTTQFAGTTQIRALVEYRGFLIGSGLSGSGKIWVSPPLGATTGTWVQITPNALSVGNIFKLLAA